jgi:uncharacterized damage-inducible protein DinB
MTAFGIFLREAYMKLLRTVALIGVALAFASQAAAQAPSLQAEMLRDWTNLKTTMSRIASEMPEDKFTFKSTPAQRSYGEQILHVATVNARFLGAVGAKTVAPAIDGKATGKAAIIKAMDDSFDYGTAILKEQTDQTMLQAAASPPQFLGPSTRARIFTFLIGHTWDIYGQMAVYLRLNNLVPPASQRP